MSDTRDLEKSDLDKQPLGSVASKEVQGDEPDDLDIHDLHVKRAGRLVVDPECVCIPPPPFPCYRHGARRSRGAHSFIPTHREARVEFGDVFAGRLKTTDDGKTILWPQPYDTPEDPQNWSARRKALQLFIVTLAAIVPDFDSGIGMCTFLWGGGRGPGT